MAERHFDAVADNAPTGQKVPRVLKEDELAAATGASSTKLLESVADGQVFEAEQKVVFRFYRPSHGLGK